MELKPTELETTFLNKLNFDLAIQVVLLLALAIYSVFAILVNKQVKILNRSIQTPRAGLLNNIALAHLVYSLLGLAVVILTILL
ncbi:MAG: hypothetical protein A2126_04195 [Candidatus Woykebacteria bacterium GWB1_45_5]|uniref:Uncharacterized protein n=2 Tax=Candidatus Woykeibacteriota TaxID=1817899 RepID=A0A1G1W1P6_9BACT|nr:MAG: hypothetical protein A2113_02000 [Candidatus Woykebacteria bacterium GWA1_44_8]OGY22342.1 MAG: hypothetical protein A2126_04195 [Candidatus Woykebacteria bacterium GWB1_45_5]